MSGPAPIVVRITGVDRTAAVFGGLSKRVTGFANQVEGIGKGLRKVGTGLVGVGVGAAVGTGLASVPGQILRVEQALKRLQFTEGFSDEQTKEIARNIRGISVASLQTQEALIPAIDKIGDAGFTLNQTMGILSQTAKVATAFGQPLDQAAESAFLLGSNFKVAAGQMNEALDVVAQLATTNIEFSELNELLGKAGTAVKSIGAGGVIGLRQVSAGLQTVRAQTGSSAQAAKTLSKLYETIVDPSTLQKFRDSAEGPGIDVSKRLEATAKAGGDVFREYLSIIKEATTKGNPTFIKQQERLAKLFGESDVKAVRALIDGLDKYDEAFKANANAQGTVQKGFNQQLETTLGQFQQFRRTIETTDIKPLSAMFKSLNAGLKSFNSNGKNASLVVNGIIGSIVGGGALIALGQLTLALKNVGGALLFVSRALPIVAAGITANPILALAVALAGIGAFAFMQAKKAADASGTEGLARGSDARKLLRSAESGSDPIAKKVAALHLGGLPGGKSDYNPFAGIKAPSASAQGKAEVTVRFENPPPGTKVTTRSDKRSQVNTSMGMAFPR